MNERDVQQGEVPYLSPPSPEIVRGLDDYMNRHAEMARAAQVRVMTGVMARRNRHYRHPKWLDTPVTDERQGLIRRFGQIVASRLF